MPMTITNAKTSVRVLVTGSRGKSSIVRFLHAAFQNAGLDTYARITGAVPRELAPGGDRTISRSARAHVEEMRWWLKCVPADADAIILENSAITGELQSLAGQWLKPDVTVLSNVLPDHQEIWGPTKDGAIEVLTNGIPTRGKLILPAGLKEDGYLLELLKRRSCLPVFAGPADGVKVEYQAANLGLALCVTEQMGLDPTRALSAMQAVEPDSFDFQVVQCGGAELALAFSANDISSTRVLFQSLCWTEQETRLIYNHRTDRPARFTSFVDWLSKHPWREVLIIGDKPRKRPASTRYLDIRDGEELLQLFQPCDKVFGCGNVAGLPLSLTTALE